MAMTTLAQRIKETPMIPAEFKRLRGMVNITDEEISQDEHLAHIMQR